MKKLNILITAVGGDIGGNIVNILLEQKKVELSIVGTDIKENIFSIDKINKFYKVLRTDNSEFANQIIKIVEDNNIDIVIPVSENEIIWFNENRELFGHLKTEIIINNSNIINTFLNKLNTSKELTNIDVLTPKTFLFSEYNNQLEFPLILKSNYSIKSKDIFVIDNKNQLDYLKISINNHKNYIIQEYIGSIDEEYTTTVYQSNNKLEVISFKRRLTGGMTSFATISNEKVLTDYAINIAKSFNLNGSINIQSRKVDNKFYIFEINPRFSSTVFIRNYFGFQDVLWWITNKNKNIGFDLQNTKVKTFGNAVLGYQYKFFNSEESDENR